MHSEQAVVRAPEGREAGIPTSRPRLRALLIGALLVVALAFMIPFFNLSLNKYDWAFRPLATGPMFLLFLLIFPVNTLLARRRPAWAFTGPELLLIYAMMAASAALANEGLHGYTTVNSVHPLYYASPGNRWEELFLQYVPPWLQVQQPEAVHWFFEGKPPGAPIPWSGWFAPMVAWSALALALYLGFFSLCCLLRKDWIEGQRLSFPFAAIPTEIAGDPVPSIHSPLFRNPYLWAGFALPVFQSLLQMAHLLAPSVPYTSLYFPLSPWLSGNGHWDAISDTTVYVGFETIGILALLPAEVSLSLWLFYLLNRAALVGLSMLGFGQEGLSARVFSPWAFLTYQQVGGSLMLALLLLWLSRRSIAGALLQLVGRPVPRDPLEPLSPRGALIGLVASSIAITLWARRTGMNLGVFAALMATYYALSLSMARLVAASGIYVPDPGLPARDLLVNLTGAGSYSAPTLTMMTYLQATFMLEYKVNFMHYTLNDLKVAHSARLPGRLLGLGMLLSVVLMLSVAPWVIIHAAYTHGAFKFDTWQFRDMGLGQFGELAGNLHAPAARDYYLPFGLLSGAAIMLLLHWLHTSFLWWGISPIGFVMAGTWGMNARIWTNALIAWILVVALRRFGGLRLYRACRPIFLGMVLGHFFIMGLRSMTDPMLGLHMQLAAWA